MIKAKRETPRARAQLETRSAGLARIGQLMGAG